MTMFSPEQFLDMQVTESNSTELIPIPIGDYLAIADKVEVKQWAKKDDPSVSGLKLQITWAIDDQAVKELLGRDKVTIRQDIMLDLTDGGTLDMGKGRNVGLGRLREAVDLNIPGQAFSFTMIPGRMAKVSVKQRLDDKVTPPAIYSEVGGVAKVA